MQYHPLTEEDKKNILCDIGVSSFEDLLNSIPLSLRHPKLNIASGLSEMEVENLALSLGAKNKTTKDVLSFLGGGSYDHFIPKAVSDIVSRSEFSTAYTPYQPEASQGTLQAIFEYQSLITELTGLDVSNASHYDGATSIAEAALVALKQTNREKILIAKSMHPYYREVLETYLKGTHYRIEEIGYDELKNYSRSDFREKFDKNTAAFIIQTPNFFGNIEDLEGLSDAVHKNGSLLIISANPLSLSVLKTPGEWGADMAAGEGQPLGISMQFGGPTLGYLASSKALVRRLPGRLVGLTEDSAGKRAFCLTLQAREQHIRRERAASNICSNQALCALAACVNMTLLGKSGIRELAEINLDRAYYLRSRISTLKQFEVNLEQPIFNEFTVISKKPFEKTEKKLLEQNIFPGISLEKFYPELKNQFIVCATETKTKEDLDKFVEVLAKC